MKIIDIETDGFLEKLTKIYCAVVYDTKTQEYTRYNAEDNGQKSINDFIEDISTGDLLAHYGIGFDYLAIRKLYPQWNPTGKLYDSVLMSQLIVPTLKADDFIRVNKPRFRDFPKKLIGSHSLKAWGWRLGDFKDDFDPADTLDTEGNPHTWETVGWSQSMEDYCVQDVKVTKELYTHLMSIGCDQRAIDLETDFAHIIKRQELFGFMFDTEGAEKLHKTLAVRKAELVDELLTYFPPWEKVIDPEFIPKVNNKTKGYVKGVPTVKTKTITFNPGSRDHITSRLVNLYNWKPTVFNKGDGKPTVDETILSTLDYPPCPLLLEYFLIDKRLGMLADGRQAWLKHVKDGRMHGRVNTLGAVTTRCTHSSPNVAQTPSIRVPYGSECRELFKVPDGYKLVGCDASALELRCLAHYMAALDDGAYTDVVLNGDVHTVNMVAAGLTDRDLSKKFIYSFLYGAGDSLIGETIGGGAKEGKRLKKQFLESLPALDGLIKGVTKKAVSHKYVRGLAGQRIPVRSAHASLNSLLQGAGATVMKQVVIELDKGLLALGLTNSFTSSDPDYEFVANIHDEFQIQAKEEHAQVVAEMSEKAMTIAGEHFNFRCRIDGEAKIGMNWKETH